MKTQELLILGGLGLAAYYLLKGNVFGEGFAGGGGSGFLIDDFGTDNGGGMPTGDGTQQGNGSSADVPYTTTLPGWEGIPVSKASISAVRSIGYAERHAPSAPAAAPVTYTLPGYPQGILKSDVAKQRAIGYAKRH